LHLETISLFFIYFMPVHALLGLLRSDGVIEVHEPEALARSS
jgi:hypothetical protein